MRVFLGLVVFGLIVVGGNVLIEVFREMNPDALGIGVGLLLGILAGLPMVLLMLASGGAGRGYGSEPSPGRRYEFSYTSEPIQPAQPAQIPQRQPGTALSYRQPSPVVYYRDEVGGEWRVEDWPKLTGGAR